MGRKLALIAIIAIVISILIAKYRHFEVTNIDRTITISGTVYSLKEGENSNRILLKNVYFDGKKIGRSLIYTKKTVKVPIFSNVILRAKEINFNRARNDGNFDEHKYYRSLNINHKFIAEEIISYRLNFIESVLNKCHDYIYNVIENVNSSVAKSIYKSLILNSDDGTREVKEIFSTYGISHILAISGLHISIISSIILAILQKLQIKYGYALIFAVIIIGFYVLVIGEPISSRRAIIMFAMQALAFLCRRTYDGLTALSISTLIELVTNIYIVENIGFILSYSLTLIIILTSRLKCKMIIKAIITNILTLPVLVFCFHKFPLLLILYNIIFIPIFSMVLFVTLLSLFISIFIPNLALLILNSLGYIIQAIVYVSGYMVDSVIYIYVGKQNIIVISAIYFGVFLIYRYIDKIAIKLLLSILLFLILVVKIEDSFILTAIDVGQGDCNIIKAESKYIMIDCGSTDIKDVAINRVIPYMDYHGIREIDYLFLSHMHYDHYSGIMSMIEKGRVKNIILTHYGIPTEPYLRLINFAKKNNIGIIYLYKGNSTKVGKIKINCLHPYREYVGNNPNSYSMVLSIMINNKRILFTGDMERAEEKLILNSIDSYDIIKIGHHGSDTSSSNEFIRKVKPKFASISCGINNRYNHPSKSVVDRLRSIKTRVDITSIVGQIRYIIGKNIKVDTYARVK